MPLCLGKSCRYLLLAFGAWIGACTLACGTAQDNIPALVGPDAAVDGTTSRPRVILMIGDGMGQGQLAAAKAQQGDLAMEGLPVRAQVVTSSLSGVTDSAAAATALATGELTFNGSIGRDAAGQARENLVELAHGQGLRSGIVTSSYLSHATPAGFSAHCDSRENLDCIVADQIANGADIMLAGGRLHFATHQDELEARGYEIVQSAEQLREAEGPRVVGLFSEEHMSYVLDRPDTSEEPSLADMSRKAIELLDQGDEGFFLMIEGARIDMASHSNDFERMRAETIDFDAAVRVVAEWAKKEGDVLLIVTADHECGGLSVGPDAQWRWGNHTNARVPLFALGPGSEVLEDRVLSHRSIYQAMRARLTQEPFVAPSPLIVPDGSLGDLHRPVATQTQPSDFGIGYNQLDALYVDANERGLAIGVEGLFEWDRNTVAIIIDRDFGDSTGIASLSGAVNDQGQGLDSIVSSLRATDPGIDGFGADLVVASRGGLEVHQEEFLDDAGARGLVMPLGRSVDLGWLSVAGNFGEGVRVRDASAGTPGEGFEVFIPWTQMYPELDGAVPTSARVAVSVVLVDDQGSYTSNQALPSFGNPVGPGPSEVALPGVVVFGIDSDGDGVGDGVGDASIVLATP